MSMIAVQRFRSHLQLNAMSHCRTNLSEFSTRYARQNRCIDD